MAATTATAALEDKLAAMTPAQLMKRWSWIDDEEPLTEEEIREAFRSELLKMKPGERQQCVSDARRYLTALDEQRQKKEEAWQKELNERCASNAENRWALAMIARNRRGGRW